MSYLAVGLNHVAPAHLFKLKLECPENLPFRQKSRLYDSMQAYLWPTLLFPLLPFTLEGALTCRAAAAQKQMIRTGKRSYRATETPNPKPINQACGMFRTLDGLADKHKPQQGGMGIAPYTAALIAPLDEILAYDTLRMLEHDGMRGAFGFYDTMSLLKGEAGKPYHSMATLHQGMILCALTNLLLDDKLAKWAGKSIPMAATLPFYECSR